MKKKNKPLFKKGVRYFGLYPELFARKKREDLCVKEL